jgi:hypothetical protein
MSSTLAGRRIGRHYASTTLAAAMPATTTRDDIDALVGPATPHFAYQLRARVRELIADLPSGDPVRRYGEEKIELLDRLGHASSKAEDSPTEPRSRPGWQQVPSSAPASAPLPRRK